MSFESQGLILIVLKCFFYFVGVDVRSANCRRIRYKIDFICQIEWIEKRNQEAGSQIYVGWIDEWQGRRDG